MEKDKIVWNTLRNRFAPSRDFHYPFTTLQHYIVRAEHLNQSALKNLYDLIEKIEKEKNRVFIVLTSYWGANSTLEEIREEMFAGHEFSKRIIGKIPPSDYQWDLPEIKEGYSFETIAKEKYGIKFDSLGAEIEFWLRYHDYPLEKANYVILDGDSTRRLTKGTRKRFVKIDFEQLLSEKKVTQACDVLFPRPLSELKKEIEAPYIRPTALKSEIPERKSSLEQLPAHLMQAYSFVQSSRVIFEKDYTRFLEVHHYVLEEGKLLVEMEIKKGRSDMSWKNFWYARCSISTQDYRIVQVIFDIFSNPWKVGKDLWDSHPFDKLDINGIKRYPDRKEIKEINAEWIDKQFEDTL